MPAASNRNISARILIVDDNAFGSVARKSVLNEHGHDVTIASGPQQALEIFAKDNFDLVVTDYKMPAMNGVELIAQLRQLRPQVRVVLLSGFTDTLGLSEENTGANAVLQKSSNEVTQLIRCVHRLLNPKKMPGSQPAAKKNRRVAGE